MFKQHIIAIFTIITLLCVGSPLQAMFTGLKSKFYSKRFYAWHPIPYSQSAKGYLVQEEDEYSDDYDSILFPKKENLDINNNNNNNNAHKEHDSGMAQVLQQFFEHDSQIDRASGYIIDQDCIDIQDAFCGFLMNKLMDPKDSTSYKTIVVAFESCPKIQQQYPEFYQIIGEHSENARPKKFLTQFHALSDEELPPSVLVEKKNIQPKIKNMGWIEYGKYAWNISGKFC